MEETATSKRPSLLRQIVDEADTLDNEQQQALLRWIKREKLTEKFKALDAELSQNEIHMTEDEIAEIVSQDRKVRYEQKIRS